MLWVLFFNLFISAVHAAKELSEFGPRIDTKHCVRLLQQAVGSDAKGYKSLSNEQISFLEKHLIPVAGLRTIRTKESFRQCEAKESCLELGNFEGSKKLRIEWHSAQKQPEIVSNAQARILLLPTGYGDQASTESSAKLIKSYLMGHSLHPFIASPIAKVERVELGEPALFLKQAQREAIEAAVDALKRGDRRFLFIAPTGTGKTEVLTQILRYQIKNSPKKLHVLVADQNILTRQLYEDVKSLQEEMKFSLTRWGGEMESGSISSLTIAAKKSTIPAVLVTTIQSLKARLDVSGESDDFRLFTENLGTFAYDEAHHAGAEGAKAVIDAVMNAPKSKTFLYGTTATPLHSETSLLDDLFEGKAFWAYIDSAKDYAKSSHPVERPFDTVVDQLSKAIQDGELAPFGSVYFVDSNEIRATDDASVFIQSEEDSGSSRFTIDPNLYAPVVKAIAPFIAKHKKGFFAAASIDEATRISDYLNTHSPGKKFAVLHSKMPEEEQAQVQDLFRKNLVHFLVTVKKLDEGINFPGMSLYVDLNRSIAPRQFLQRVGRVLRIAPNKEEVDIVAFMPMSEENLREKIALIDAILEGRFQSSLQHEESSEQKEKTSSRESAEIGLQKLREIQLRLIEFWERDRNQAPIRAATQVSDFYENWGRLPRKTGANEEERILYIRLQHYKNNSEFRNSLGQASPTALRDFLNWSEKNSKSIEAYSAELIRDFYLDHKRLPKKDKSPEGEQEFSLYNRLNRNREKALFDSELKRICPEAWSAFQRWKVKLSAPEKLLVNEIKAFFEKNGRIPRYTKTPSDAPELSLYRRMKNSLDANELDVSLFDEAPATQEAFRIWAKDQTLPNDPIVRAVNELVEHIAVHGEMPGRTTGLGQRLLKKFLENEEFDRALFKLDPAAFGVWNRFKNQRALGPMDSAAEDLSDFFQKHGILPKSSGPLEGRVEKRLYEKLLVYRDAPQFLNHLLKIDPVASESVAEWKRISRLSPAQLAAERVAAFFNRNSRLPKANKSDLEELAAYKLTYKYRENSDFIKHLRKLNLDATQAIQSYK